MGVPPPSRAETQSGNQKYQTLISSLHMGGGSEKFSISQNLKWNSHLCTLDLKVILTQIIFILQTKFVYMHKKMSNESYFLSPHVLMHGGLLCVALHLSVWTSY